MVTRASRVLLLGGLSVPASPGRVSAWVGRAGVVATISQPRLLPTFTEEETEAQGGVEPKSLVTHLKFHYTRPARVLLVILNNSFYSHHRSSGLYQEAKFYSPLPFFFD